jgi:hypothetical protein
MKIVILGLLSMSLTANAWLLLRPAPVPPSSDVALVPARPAGAKEAPAAALVRLLSASDSVAPEQLRDRLRAAGADESFVRAMVEAALRRRFEEEARAAAAARGRGEWWRRAAPGGPAGPSQRKMVLEPLQALMGPDPFDLADTEVRYDFLSPEKRRLLAAIDRDYGELQTRAVQARSNAALKAEVDELQLLADERRKDILAALSPEERAEYDLRFSASAARNARRYDGMNVTEEEYRAIQPIVARFSEQSSTLPGGSRGAAYTDLQQRTVDDLVAAVGYDKAVEYLWSNDSGPYARTAGVLREAGLPERQAARLLQLASDVGERAAAIHYDAALTAEQKRAALLAVRDEAASRFEALAPPATRAKLPEEATEWLTLLGEGRYRRSSPSLTGIGWATYPLATVTTPPTGPKLTLPTLRRPGN